MICKSSGYTPIAWTWYKINGSEQVRFPSVGKAKNKYRPFVKYNDFSL